MQVESFSFNNKTFKISVKNLDGLSSNILKTECGYVIKDYKKGQPYHDGCFERELFWLERLKKTGCIPEVIDVDINNRAILMRDVGTPVSQNNLPEDWREKIKNILYSLREYNCKHNDMSESEILVKRNQLYLIDFGYASINGDMTCKGKVPDAQKNRLFDDKYIINLIELVAGKRFKYAEPHCFVLWDLNDRKMIEQYLSDQFAIIQTITYYPEALKKIGSGKLKNVLNQFYQGRSLRHGQKGQNPFMVYIVFDEQPCYESRNNVYSGDEFIVNTNLFDLKVKLRRGRSGYIHGSDTIQESYDNLEALTYNSNRVPIRYWETWRPKFKSCKSFFNTLNNVKGLKYVVLRNFDNLPDNQVCNQHTDLDVLVNDYYLFKRVVGGISYKHKLPKNKLSVGPAYEYGGYKVANKVSIGGYEVTVDIRYVGDNYYDVSWEEDILENRVSWNSLFVPDSVNYFYSLLYHALVHKRQISKDYRFRLQKMAVSLKIELDSSKDEELWSVLDRFMSKHGYNYCRPHELNIPFNAREQANITNDLDLKEAKKLLFANRYIEALHLLRQILLDTPIDIRARFLYIFIRLLINFDEKSIYIIYYYKKGFRFIKKLLRNNLFR